MEHPVVKPSVEAKMSDFYPPLTFTGHNFAASWAMMKHSGSSESSKTYLFVLHILDSLAALLSHVFLAESNPIYAVLIK